MILRAALAALLWVAPAAAQQVTAAGTGAVLRGLDKVSGRTTDFDLTVGQSARFGRLTIFLRECRYPSSNAAGEAFAGLEITEAGAEAAAFSGWMVASAPALSAMDHGRYDVWVIRCTTS